MTACRHQWLISVNVLKTLQLASATSATRFKAVDFFFYYIDISGQKYWDARPLYQQAPNDSAFKYMDRKMELVPLFLLGFQQDFGVYVGVNWSWLVCKAVFEV